MANCKFNYRGKDYTEEEVKPIVTYHYMIEEELLTNEQFTKEGSDVKVTTPLNTIDVKPGVQELFDSNPELANQVYEALGLNTTIVQDNKSYYRGQIEEPIIDKNGNLVLYAKEDELYKRAGL